jgi:hypothetical protein
MSFVSEIEAMFVTSSLKRNRAIDEKSRIIYIVFVAEFCEKLSCKYIFCRFKLCMESIVRIWMVSSVQSILFIVRLNHDFTDRNVIWAPTRFWP